MAADGGAAQGKGQDERVAPVIIKRVKKGGHDAHHGGAWKVAYADFVTAMMAFFLLLWLLNATTEEQKLGISNYFAPESASRSKSGSGGVLGGQTISKSGALATPSSPATITIPIPRPPEPDPDAKPTKKEAQQAVGGKSDDDKAKEAAAKVAAKVEEKRFKEVETKLRRAMEATPELRGLTENLLIERTSEGLRIQLVDRTKVAMFSRGSAAMHKHTRALLKNIAGLVAKLPNKVAIAGHTDATRYANPKGYSNWELSSDRANATRRALTGLGLPPERIVRVAGKADREPLIKAKPNDPRNRRISITLLREYKPAAGAAKSTAKPPQKATR